jgi:hypothetical protein
MLGSIIFNYAFIVMVPSWLNEKRAEVSVNRTVWSATITSTLLYLAVGLCGGLAYDNVQGNFLNSLASHCNPTITRLAAFLFAIVCVGLSVPIFCIMVRYNLIVDGLCGDRTAIFYSVILPFMTSWLFYHGGAFNLVVSWSGQLNNGPVNFIFPLLVALRAVNVAISRYHGDRAQRRSRGAYGEDRDRGRARSMPLTDDDRRAPGAPGGTLLRSSSQEKDRRDRDRERRDSRARDRERERRVRGVSPMPSYGGGGGGGDKRHPDVRPVEGGGESAAGAAGGVMAEGEEGGGGGGGWGGGLGGVGGCCGGGCVVVVVEEEEKEVLEEKEGGGAGGCCGCRGAGVPRRSLYTTVSPLPKFLLVYREHILL